jgi:hypothetical protein
VRAKGEDPVQYAMVIAGVMLMAFAVLMPPITTIYELMTAAGLRPLAAAISLIARRDRLVCRPFRVALIILSSPLLLAGRPGSWLLRSRGADLRVARRRLGV